MTSQVVTIPVWKTLNSCPVSETVILPSFWRPKQGEWRAEQTSPPDTSQSVKLTLPGPLRCVEEGYHGPVPGHADMVVWMMRDNFRKTKMCFFSLKKHGCCCFSWTVTWIRSIFCLFFSTDIPPGWFHSVTKSMYYLVTQLEQTTTTKYPSSCITILVPSSLTGSWDWRFLKSRS